MFILAQNRDWKKIREDVNNGSMEIVAVAFFLLFFLIYREQNCWCIKIKFK